MTTRTHIRIGKEGFCRWLGCAAGQDKAREAAQALGLDPSAVTCEYADPAQAQAVAEALKPLFREGAVTVVEGECHDYAVEMFKPAYAPWRHGGWYVVNAVYPSGAVGCVSRNYPDKKWRIACDKRPFETAPTFKNRTEAAKAEYRITLEEKAKENAQA